MSHSSVPEGKVPTFLEQISTHWPLISDPLQFALRYAPAVRSYLAALIKEPHDAEDVTQNFLLQMLQEPFNRDRLRSGRFRDYLKAALRNAAITHFRRSQRQPAAADLDYLPAPQLERAADDIWIAEWRSCLLQRAWQALEQHERPAPDSQAYTVLRLATDHTDENSVELALRTQTLTGHVLRPDAFRKQLSRARRHFAQYIVDAISPTLVQPNSQQVIDELAELGLTTYVRDFLPELFRDTAK